MNRILTALAIVLLGGVARADDKLDVLAPVDGVAPNKMLRTFLLAEAKKAFDARQATIAALKTPEDIKNRQAEVRAKLIAALGGFPEKTPLKPEVVGKESFDGYRIEKVIFQSRPDHHVTATLYLPNGDGPFPGVLMPIGHSNSGKADGSQQRAAILLAKNGIASLAYDPIGQGERRQLLDPPGKPAIPSSTNEHTLIGVGAMLIGEGTATYRIWDGIRSIDYLASRPEIDAKRLGCTGCSGGGTLTSYLMALDERILAAAPSCYLTTLERLFATIGPQDGEQNIPGQVALGIDHADYIFLRAPRPTLILAATRDFFDIQGTWTTFREAKRIYGLLGLPERVDILESDTGHGYPKSHREAMARFMCRWLLGKDLTVTEPDFPILKEEALRCTRTGQVLEDFKGRSCFDMNRAAAERLATAHAAKPLTRDELLAEVRRKLALPATIPAATSDKPSQMDRDGYVLLKRVYTTEPGIRVPAWEFVPAKATRGPLVVLVAGEGKASVLEAAEKRVRAGERVLALDLRGMGETAPSKPKPGPTNYFGGDYFEAWVSIHLNRPLLGQRTYDLLAVLAAQAKDNPQGFHLIGTGTAGPIVQHAAALEPLVKSVETEGSIKSWTDVVKTPLATDQLTNVVPGVLRAYDLPDLKK
jgi:cephalosporin-C deacetylase-like acetyl esterase